MTAKEIGKFLFYHHSHFQEDEDNIYYNEQSVLDLLKLLGAPEPDWNWHEDDKKNEDVRQD